MTQVWHEISLFELANQRRDLFNDGDWIESPYITTSGNRLLQTGNVGVGRLLDRGTRRYVSDDSFAKLKCKEVVPGDILICRLADPAGRACVVPQIGERRMLTSVDVTIFRPDERKADRRFLVAVFSTPHWFQEVSDRCGGSTRTRIARSELGRIRIRIPDRAEQVRIADAIGDAEGLIATVERLIAKKQAIKQGMMQQLLSGKTQLASYAAGSGGSVGARLSEISGFITKGATPTTYGYRWQDSGVLFLRSECVSPRGLDLRQAMFISEEAHRSLQRSQVADGDILMTITGNVGRVVRLRDVGVANINQHIARIRVRDNRFDSGFVYHYLSQKGIREHYESITTGQAYPQISLTQVRNTVITAHLLISSVKWPKL
jgi:type I restriction enzyme S subunit